MTFTWKSPREGVMDARKLAGGVLLVLRAEQIQKQRTGVHGKVTVALAASENATSAQPVISDFFNLDKEAQRADFVTVLYGASRSSKIPKFSEQFRQAYPREEFERDFYDFTEELYPQFMGSVKAGLVHGDSEKTVIPMLIDDLVLVEGGTVIYAPPKSAKSYLTLLMAVSVDAGVSRFFNVRQVPVLFINLERGERSLARRLGLVNRVLGLEADRPLLMVNERGKRLSDVYDAAARLIEKEGVKLVFLDSLTRGGFGDLNGNEQANTAMDYMNRLCPAWVAIAHTPRQDDSHIFGSQMFDSAMDVGINVRREKKADGTVGIGLVVKETNDTGSPPMRVLAFEFDQHGLKHVRDATVSEFPELEGETSTKARTNAERIRDQLKAFGKSSVSQLADDLRINVGTVHSEVKKMLDAGEIVSLGKEGRSIVYGLPMSKDVKFGGQS